jgi:hypothetical protein
MTLISVFIVEEVLELLPGFIVNWQMVQSEEDLLLGVVSVPCREDVICLNGSEQRQMQNGGRHAKLLLCSVHSQAQARGQRLSQKQFEHL